MLQNFYTQAVHPAIQKTNYRKMPNQQAIQSSHNPKITGPKSESALTKLLTFSALLHKTARNIINESTW